MRSLAIIPARGGSKRIPRKNLYPFLGRPMLTYPLALAREAGCFTDIMISTDDQEIAALAREHGAEVPFFRSAETSSDTATTAAVIVEVMKQMADRGRTYDLLCCIYPTAILMQTRHLLGGERMVREDESCDGAMPVVPFSFPIQRSLREEEGFLRYTWPEHASTRSQDLPKRFHDAGQFYWSKTARFEKSHQLLSTQTRPIVLAEWEVQDIDDESDLRMAEIKYKILQERGLISGALQDPRRP
jgi:N-acylneuraminate cytidylyltransferase